MRLPIICLDPRFGQYLLRFRHCFSKPQYKYFVTILLGLMLCQGASTLSGVIGQVEGQVSLSGSSRFLSSAPWSADEVSRTWFDHFASEMAPMVEEEHSRRRAKRPKRRGRPKATVVTGYLIGDDSVMQKVRGKKMGGLGHSLFEYGREDGCGSLSGPGIVCAAGTSLSVGAADVSKQGGL